MASLTPRQLEVIALAGQGKTCREIARELDIRYNSVRTHISRALEVTGAHDRAHLVAIALSAGLIEPVVAPTAMKAAA